MRRETSLVYSDPSAMRPRQCSSNNSTETFLNGQAAKVSVTSSSLFLINGGKELGGMFNPGEH